jgi:hypothetical protein
VRGLRQLGRLLRFVQLHLRQLLCFSSCATLCTTFPTVVAFRVLFFGPVHSSCFSSFRF